jgi:hypothetical protein
MPSGSGCRCQGAWSDGTAAGTVGVSTSRNSMHRKYVVVHPGSGVANGVCCQRAAGVGVPACLEMTAAAGSVRCAGVQMRCVNSAGGKEETGPVSFVTSSPGALCTTRRCNGVVPAPKAGGGRRRQGSGLSRLHAPCPNTPSSCAIQNFRN